MNSGAFFGKVYMLTLTYSIRNKAVPVSDGAKRFLLVFRAPPARGKARTPKVRESRDSRVPDLLSPRTPLSPAVCVVLRTKTHLPLSKAHINAPAQRTFNVNKTLPAPPRRAAASQSNCEMATCSMAEWISPPVVCLETR